MSIRRSVRFVRSASKIGQHYAIFNTTGESAAANRFYLNMPSEKP